HGERTLELVVVEKNVCREDQIESSLRRQLEPLKDDVEIGGLDRRGHFGAHADRAELECSGVGRSGERFHVLTYPVAERTPVCNERRAPLLARVERQLQNVRPAVSTLGGQRSKVRVHAW